MSGTPWISVVVVARDEERRIGRCMASLARQTAPAERLEVLLVDDGSRDATVEVARRALPGLRVVAGGGGSIAAARNRGWREARGALVAFLDADCVAPPHWLATLAAGMERRRVAAVGGGNVPPSGVSPFYDALALALDTWVGSRGSPQGTAHAHEHEVPHLPGLNVLFDRRWLEAVGGYDERFARVGEDEDLSRRIGAEGGCLVFLPGAVVEHHQRDTLRAWARNMHLYGRGRTRLLRRHPQAASPVFLLPPLVLPLLPFYLPFVATAGLVLALRAGRPALAPRVAAILACTHVAYGLGQLAALRERPGRADRPEEAGPRLALVVLKNAGNKGDEALFLSVCERLLEARRSGAAPCRPYALGLGPSGVDVRPLPATCAGVERLARDLLAPSEGARTLRPWGAAAWGDAFRLATVLVRFDRLLFCGGQWLHDLRPTWHLVLCGLLAAGRAAGARPGVFCVGVGPLRGRIARRALRLAFGSEAFAVVRDPASAELLRACGLARVREAADPALELAAGPGPGRHGAEAAVGVVPCAWHRFEKLYRRDAETEAQLRVELRVLCRGILERGLGVRLLPTMNPEDARLAQRLAAELRGEGDVAVVATASLPVAALQERIAGLRAVVAMRLHPLIFAGNVGTPFVALDYADKVRQFCRQLGAEERCVDITAPGWGKAALGRLDALLAEAPPARGASPAHAALRARLDDAYRRLARWLAPAARPASPARARPGAHAARGARAHVSRGAR